jgi:hypothetical protein
MMRIRRRDFIAGAGAALLGRSALASIHGSSQGAINRILVLGYGQSNMGTFFGASSANMDPPVAVPASVSSPSTLKWNKSTLVLEAIPAANGMRVFCNTLATATGLPVVILDASVGATFLSDLMKPVPDPGTDTIGFDDLIRQATAIIQPTDQVFIIFDQGENDTGSAPPEAEIDYRTKLATLYHDILASIGRTTANCPMLVAQLGCVGLDGSLNDDLGVPFPIKFTGGARPLTHHRIQAAHYSAALETPGIIFSHSNTDFDRSYGSNYLASHPGATVYGDQVHYNGAAWHLGGARFAHAALKFMGLATGNAHWHISGGSVVDATHTTIDLVHSMGTDFTPTSGLDGWEVTGDNGATWSAATGVRNSATQILLTHASVTTTSARKIRYQYGYGPVNSGYGTSPGYARDNSSLQIPLTPTTWDISLTPLTVTPVPTKRGAYFIGSGGGGTIVGGNQTGVDAFGINNQWCILDLGQENQQKFVIFSLQGRATAITPTSLLVTPLDIHRNPVGSAVVPTLVKDRFNIGLGTGTAIYKALLPVNANAATCCRIDVNYPGYPSGGSRIDLWTVPAADLSSTTEFSTGSSETASSTSGTVTLNTSAGGCVIVAAETTGTQSQDPSIAGYIPVFSGDEAYSYLDYDLLSITADAANVVARTRSNCTITFQAAGTVLMTAAYWR